MYGFVNSVLAEKGRQVYTIPRTATVSEAVREMNEKGVGSLLVMGDRRPAGIFTERDVLRRVVDADHDPALTRVGEVMTRDIAIIDPAWHVEDAMRLMTDRRLRHLPVMDGDDLVGMISIGDLLRWVTINQEDHIRAMTEYINGRA
ncbi:MAG: CBS domain-containing protein [Chloroflexi bacterium]|nr:CBS domain-containing protein [Dehalococcoidia bacterium]MCO5200855.1 CBS domain-containing protein [Chloroflexota bacterium]NJD64597.1 CBS domain-containing protein [Chloroflexota bacterium]